MDKLTNIVHDLRSAAYTFVTTAGTFENRFELRFTNESFVETNSTLTQNDIKIISDSGQQLQIISPATQIVQVEVFDILGKLLFSQKDLNTNLFQTNSLNATTQIVIVKVRFKNQDCIMKKVGVY